MAMAEDNKSPITQNIVVSTNNIVDLVEKLYESTRSSQHEKDKQLLHAHAFIQWLLEFHFPSKIRKSKLPIVITSPKRGHLQIYLQQLHHTSASSTLEDQEGSHGADNNSEKMSGEIVQVVVGANSIETDPPSDFIEEKHKLLKGIHGIFKKVYIEDLGQMNACELESYIPKEDSEGRGLKDLHALEKKLSVKVVFDHVTNHILLVGDKKKLEKKVFVLRNMLSHYHWRLSGNDAQFDKAVSK